MQLSPTRRLYTRQVNIVLPAELLFPLWTNYLFRGIFFKSNASITREELRVSDPILASKQNKNVTVISIDKHSIGSGSTTIIAGPCAVENRGELLTLALELKDMGVHFLRGGAYKPRTSPYQFQGLREEGLQILHEAGKLTGLPVITEVTDIRDLELVMKYADILQIGSRNMQNFALLKEIGKTDRPVLLKRGFAATIEEWLLAAEYILAEGNWRVILCERGIRTFEKYTRNTFDISAIPAIKHLSHLPVIGDPSHGTGRPELVAPVAKACIAAGADGIMVEVHPRPENALCDGFQSLTPKQMHSLIRDIRRLEALRG